MKVTYTFTDSEYKRILNGLEYIFDNLKSIQKQDNTNTLLQETINELDIILDNIKF